MLVCTNIDRSYKDEDNKHYGLCLKRAKCTKNSPKSISLLLK